MAIAPCPHRLALMRSTGASSPTGEGQNKYCRPPPFIRAFFSSFELHAPHGCPYRASSPRSPRRPAQFFMPATAHPVLHTRAAWWPTNPLPLPSSLPSVALCPTVALPALPRSRFLPPPPCLAPAVDPVSASSLHWSSLRMRSCAAPRLLPLWPLLSNRALLAAVPVRQQAVSDVKSGWHGLFGWPAVDGGTNGSVHGVRTRGRGETATGAGRAAAGRRPAGFVLPHRAAPAVVHHPTPSRAPAAAGTRRHSCAGLREPLAPSHRASSDTDRAVSPAAAPGSRREGPRCAAGRPPLRRRRVSPLGARASSPRDR